MSDMERAQELGWKACDHVHVDFPAVMERLRRIRASISPHDSAKRYGDLGVDMFIGEGRFIDRETVEVAGKKLKFKKAVIATGARALRPSIPGLAEAGFLTNETVFNLTELPKRFAVIGGGPIGCELAQAFRRFGSEVTLIDVGPKFLPREDQDAAEVLMRVFEKEGIGMIFNAKVNSVEVKGKTKILRLNSGGKAESIEVDEILVGTGRIPNVEGIGLEAVGVQYDTRAGVRVNDYLQTTNPRIYAAGDVCNAYKFTHTADSTARIVIQNALFMGRAKVSGLVVPWCTYTSPEIAHVGLYEKEAKEKGMEVDTYTQPFSGVDRAIAEGETTGFVKVHVEKGTDRIVGATIVASHAGEMISEITTAIVGKVGLGKMASVIHPYPTEAEAIKKIADAYRRTKLTPPVKKIFTAWLSFNR